MIGNAEEAEFIHNWWHSPLRKDYNDAPEGWTYLSGGYYRVGYLAPSGVVYKVQKDLSNEGWQTNKGEWDNWKRLYLTCKMPKRSRLPKLGYWPVSADNELGVIAIELLDGAYGYYRTFSDKDGNVGYWSDVLREVTYATRLHDLYGNNVMISEKEQVLVPTDLGASSGGYS